jgi:hypothetical protein
MRMELSSTYHVLDYALQNVCCKNNKPTEAQITIGQYADTELKKRKSDLRI